MNFTATRAGALIAVTTGSQNIDLVQALNLDVNRVASASDVLIDNRSAFDQYVLFGAANLLVDKNTAVRVPAGSIGLYGKGNALSMSVVGDGAGDMVIHLGEGA